ncbi:serine hydrolase [Paenisporosarcina sp. TG-14]|uniref:serine hydrolase n=1 Tax=Paenisporosarcina sp. TG-14 TaxID=1231057 RepID=UPI000474B8FE|nr:serine hydrolase [Paenisporosarcina sp. TG-14]
MNHIIKPYTQFHIASVRKSYIGFTVAYAIYKGYIESIDDLVTKYYSTSEPQLFEDTTLRHLLTHTHGLKYGEGKILREFLPGKVGLIVVLE